MPKNTLITVYHSLITPHLNYHLISWGYDQRVIYKLQKRALRIITNSHFLSHTEPLFKQLNILSLPDLHCLVQMKFLYKYYHNILPDYFMQNVFLSNHQNHSHRTINRLGLVTPYCKHKFAQLTPRYSIVNLFNTIPKIVTEKLFTHSLHGFIKYFKYYIINKYSNICSTQNCFICNIKLL